MADPISIAGSAVGVVSLGIQACQEIISYCRSWRDWDEDVQKLASKADGLCTPLKKVREMIENAQITDPGIASDLEKKALGIQEHVTKLKMTVDRYKPIPSPHSFPEKIGVQFKKAAYPFRKDALREMANDLDSIQIAFQTTLDIHSAQKMLELGFVQETILKEVQELRLTLHGTHNKCMPPPAMLRSWCDQHRGHTQLVTASLQTEKRTDKTIFSTDADRSRANRYPRSSRSVKSVTKSYEYYSRLLGLAITTSFSLSKGAGGFSIAPMLHFQNVVSIDSWIGCLWRECKRELDSAGSSLSYENAIDNTIHKLQRAFTEGRAAPSDIVRHPDGRQVSLVDHFCDWNMGFMDSIEMTPKPINLTRFLVESGSIPNTSYLGPLRRMCRYVPFGEEEFLFASYLIGITGPLTIEEPPTPLTEKQNLKLLLSRNEDLLSVPQIALIILRESENDLKEALVSGSSSPNDMIGRSCSLLELAFGWPRGVQILLESGADAKQLDVPLSYELWQIDRMDPEDDGYTPSAQLLLEAGCKINISDFITYCRSRRIRSLIINELAARRRRLWRMARAFLPANELPDCGKDEDAIPDIRGSGVYAALVAQGRHIDPSLHPDIIPDYAIKFHQFSEAETLEEMQQVGFREVGSLPTSEALAALIDTTYFTGPCQLEKAVRIISQGADTSQKLPRSNTTIAHLLSVRITRAVTRTLQWSKTPRESWQSWKKNLLRVGDGAFLIPSVEDHCACACSPGGCTTLSVTLRYYSWTLSSFTFRDPEYLLRETLRFIVEWTKSIPGVDQAIIRFLTFDALALTHTCCTELHRDDCYYTEMEARDEMEIRDILEEDKHGLEYLEQLVPEFCAKFDEMGVPIMEFLEGYWHTRMVEILSVRDPYNEEHHKGARSLGVFLEAEEDSIPGRVSLIVGARVNEVEYHRFNASEK